jgi:histidinol-phosphate/aromatic aminotransferase/cobyric acid decarboxylase-like protein
VKLRFSPQPSAHHGGAWQGGIDLSASLNPLGPSPAALEAARTCELGRYPEVDARSLVEAAARRHCVPDESIVPVPGASWGLWLCAVALLRPGDRCVAVGPCFGEYERHAAICGAQYREVGARPAGSWPAAALEAALDERPAMCLIGNPANPAGTAVSGAVLHALCAAHPDTCFVVDEAFAPFAPAGTSMLGGGLPPANALVVRSLTKELGLPGLRMGYLVAEPATAAALAGVLPAWPLSAPAIAAAVAGMADTAHVDAGAALARRLVDQVSAAFSETGAATLPSVVNYFLAYAPGAAAALPARGVAVRDCASFGLPGYVRVAAPRAEQLGAVLEAVRSLDGSRHG